MKQEKPHNPKGVGQKCGLDGKLMYQFAEKTKDPKKKPKKQ